MWSLPEIRISARNRFILLAGMFALGVLAVTFHLSDLSIDLVETAEHIGRAEGGVRVALYSDAPFPWRKDRKLDAFQKRAWEELRKNSTSFIEEFDWQRRILRFATADVLQRSCINCHNSHPDTPRSNWKEGDVRGVLEVSLPLGTVISQTKTGLRRTFVLMTCLGALGLASLLLVVAGLRDDAAMLRRQARETEDALVRQREANRALDRQAMELQCLNEQITRHNQATRDSNVELAN
jgi:adenylate cyclase